MHDSGPFQNTGRGGLSSDEVARRRVEFGWNEIERGRKASPLTVLLRQFSGFLVLILIVAGVIAFLAGQTVDALAIGLVVILNGILGFVQEWRAETALEALRELMAPNAMVVRDDRETIVPARELVPGDLVLLEAGDTVPADLALRFSVQLKLDESILTGESVPVEKTTGSRTPNCSRAPRWCTAAARRRSPPSGKIPSSGISPSSPARSAGKRPTSSAS